MLFLTSGVMSEVRLHPWLQRYAAATLGVALVTVVAGTLVTSMKAGMAFRDWPTSDGYLMVTYPWFRDFARDWDRFLEHGHRLAGMAIGLFAIGLVAVTHRYEARRSVRWTSIGVLFGVICQGLLGGFRVRLDDFGLAQLHGAFAAIVCSAIAMVMTMLGARWVQAASESPTADVEHLRPFAVISIVALAFQYFLGGLIRHHGTGLHEHLGMGFIVLCLLLANAWLAMTSGVRWIRQGGTLLALVVTIQVLLGLGSWVMRYGHGSYVAVVDSIEQVSIRTAHAVVGILTFMVSVVYAARVFRVYSVARPTPTDALGRPHSNQWAGGAA